ncbi:MAG TPA: flagellar hook-associated protein FlgK [Steroidobacteraceae bacterium]|nr:flagellar hook-associated protein FlgK [Steroidobacteraceae bacterium]
MSDLFGISLSALQAFRTAIAVTSNNIANANTPGYAEESVQLTSAVPQGAASTPIGAGVNVAGIARAYSQVSENQYSATQSGLGQLNSLQTYTNQIDNIIGTTAGGLTSALQNYYNGWSTVANDPTLAAARQALIGQAQSVASSIQTTNGRLQALNTDINAGITSDVKQINSIGTSISTLNQQIVIATAQAGGQPPNDLIDQRDALVSNLAQLVGVSTTTDSNGALNVFIGNGQPLVLQGVTTTLTTVPNQYNASQLEISTAANGNNPISSQITAGDLGGLLAARSQAVNPAINQLGQIATALSTSANSQQNSGLDLTGQPGAALFSVGAPLATASSNNGGTASASVSIAPGGVAALTPDNYTLEYRGGAYSLTNATTGAAVAFTGTGTAANPISADGLSIVVTGAPNSGDKFLVEPTANASNGFNVVLSNPSQLAAAAALQSTSAPTNTGSATIGNFTNPADKPLPPGALTVTFPSATTYSINGGAAQAIGPSQTISLGNNAVGNFWTAQLTGTPAAGDQFTLQSNAGATGDNTNALATANQETLGVLAGGTISVSSATGALVTAVGSQAQQVNTAQTAQAAVNSQAQQTVQSISGVNLDQEAAALLQWQQAYQASAQAMAIGNTTFTTFMDAINGTYS